MSLASTILIAPSREVFIGENLSGLGVIVPPLGGAPLVFEESY